MAYLIEKETFLRSQYSYSHCISSFIYLVSFKVCLKCLKHLLVLLIYLGCFLVFLGNCPIALTLTIFLGFYLSKDAN